MPYSKYKHTTLPGCEECSAPDADNRKPIRLLNLYPGSHDATRDDTILGDLEIHWLSTLDEPIQDDKNLDASANQSANTPRSEEDEREYEALSYHWGPRPERDDDEANSIHLLRNRKPYTMPVIHNLMSALKHLRLKEDTRRLWIDAICIDQ